MEVLHVTPPFEVHTCGTLAPDDNSNSRVDLENKDVVLSLDGACLDDSMEAGIHFVSDPVSFATGQIEELHKRPASLRSGDGSSIRSSVLESNPSKNILGSRPCAADFLRVLHLAKEGGTLDVQMATGSSGGGEDLTSTPMSPSIWSGSVRSGCMFRAVPEEELNLFPELTSFAGCEELLRGAPLSTVLSRQGRVFKTASGDSRTFAMADQVQRIDAFISHNWDVPGWIKFLALSHHFTFSTAAIACVLFWAVAGILQANGVLPTVVDKTFEYETGFLCRFLHFPVFAVFLLFFQDLKECLGVPAEPHVFLDKLCINQVNRSLQQKGILKLSAFLCHSDTMLSLYTNVYLEKLWTVFEVASFLALRPLENMIVVPCELVRFYYIGLVFCWLSAWVPIVIHLFVDFDGVETLLWFTISGGAVIFVCRQWAHSRFDVYERLKHFSVRNCRCAVESDRPLVSRNIAVLIRSKIDQPDATDEEALDIFDSLVRQELPDVFAASFSTISVSWPRVVLWGFLCMGSYIVDVNCAMYAQGASIAEAFITGIPRIWWILAGLPLLFAIMEFIAAQQPHLRGIWDILYLIPSFWLLVGLPGYGLDLIMRSFADQVTVAGTAVCLSIALATGSLVGVLFAYGRRRGNGATETDDSPGPAEEKLEEGEEEQQEQQEQEQEEEQQSQQSQQQQQQQQFSQPHSAFSSRRSSRRSSARSSARSSRSRRVVLAEAEAQQPGAEPSRMMSCGRSDADARQVGFSFVEEEEEEEEEEVTQEQLHLKENEQGLTGDMDTNNELRSARQRVIPLDQDGMESSCGSRLYSKGSGASRASL